MSEPVEAESLVTLTADIASAYVSKNQVATGDVAAVIHAIHKSLKELSAPAEMQPMGASPAVPIRLSVKRDYIVCLEDGRKLKMLKRYLQSKFNMSPAEYRAKWGLKADYPMVAPSYSETRKGLALAAGLGRKRAEPQQPEAELKAKRRGGPKAASKVTSEAPKRRRRKAAEPTPN